MVTNIPTEEVVNLGPFRAMVMTIGTLPTAFTESMTYYEALAYFVRYLEETIIPAINQNAEVTKELQQLFVELKQYVDDYFENLDVQEEINNKLDEMAESGQLSEIITAYLNAKSILAYNNKAEMKAATNIIDGSFLATYGDITVNDSFVRFYKAREIKNTDVVDDVNIIALSDENLVAELINDNRVETIETTLENVEETQNNLIGRSRNVELGCDLIYDANDTDLTQGCAMIGNTLYSCERGADNVTGKIVTFNLSDSTYLTTYSSLRIWHAGDATSLNNKIYMASANVSANKAITVFDPANQSVTDITPFGSSTKELIGGIAEHNSKLLCKLENNSNLDQLLSAEYYLYDPTNNTSTQYTISNPLNLPANYWGTTQSTNCIGDKYYVMTSNPNTIIECNIDDENHTISVNAVYNIPLIDHRGLTIGELQGLTTNPNAENEMIVTSYIKDNGIDNLHTTKVYRINLVNGNPSTVLKYPTDNIIENGQQVVYVDQTSTSLLENGTTTYPFKTLNRGIAAGTHPNKQWNTITNITITGNGTYQTPKLFNKKFTIVANSGVTINFAQATQCNIEIASGTTRPLIVFNPTFGASQIQDNSHIVFKNVVLQNSSHNVSIKNSSVRTYTCLVNANDNFFDLAENSTFYDGSHTEWTFGDASYYAFNVTGGSQLFLFDNQSPFSPSSVAADGRIRRSDRRGTVIFPGLYH